MIKKIYALYDVKTGVYGTPMFMLSDGEVIRTCQDTVDKPGNMLADHPQDFRLDELGSFHQMTGELTPIERPRHVIDLAQLKKPV